MLRSVARTSQALRHGAAGLLGAAALLGGLASSADAAPRFQFSFSQSGGSDFFVDQVSTVAGLGSTANPNLAVVSHGVTVRSASPQGTAPASLQFLPEPGDIVQAIDPQTAAIEAQFTYAGRPAFRDGACIGSSTITGVRPFGHAMRILVTDPPTTTPSPGPYQPATGIPPHFATVTEGASGPGSTFTATLDGPLTKGQTLTAVATWEDADFTISEATRYSPDPCPPTPTATPIPAPAPAPTPADVTAPRSSQALPKSIKKVALSTLLSKGIAATVSANEPSTATGVVSLRTTTGKGKKKRTHVVVVGAVKPTTVLAGKSTAVVFTFSTAGAARIKTAAGRAGARLVAVLTVTDSAGNRTTLPATSYTLPKA